MDPLHSFAMPPITTKMLATQNENYCLLLCYSVKYVQYIDTNISEESAASICLTMEEVMFLWNTDKPIPNYMV
jgi:hypothetical protein